METTKSSGLFLKLSFIAVLAIAFAPAALRAADLTGSYEWNPVSIGAGGWVTGLIIHPLDANIRYCRTDVGNAYRWDSGNKRWVPIVVVGDNGSGIPESLVTAPGATGIDSIAIDRANKNVVLVAFPMPHSPDVEKTFPSVLSSVYRSEDGGRTFSKSDLAIPGDPNGQWRSCGERLKIDPLNSKIVYFGSASSGLYRSFDGGREWSPVRSDGVPASGNLMNVQIDSSAGAANLQGKTVSQRIFIVAGGGDVTMSDDGGQTWANISKGTALSGHAGASTLDQSGSLYIAQVDAKSYWCYRDKKWIGPVAVPAWDGVQNIAIDPENPAHLFVLGRGGSLSRSTDGGATWKTIASQFEFANSLGWLPQPVAGWRSNSGAIFDRDGTLWVAQGNEGILRWTPPAVADKPVRWTIESTGIEELCSQEITVPKGGGGHAYVAVQDATGMVISNPAHSTARWIALDKRKLITHGTSLAACPNDPNFVAIAATDGNFGYTGDGGKTWRRFSGLLPFELTSVAGAIAVSRRGDWQSGADHMVILPSNNRAPCFTTDGGKTWNKTQSFPTNNDGSLQGAQTGDWGYFLKQHPLRADPFTPDRYYLKLTTGGFYNSTDAGKTWVKVSDDLPLGTHHGQLEVSYTTHDDLWYCDGFGGSFGGKFSSPHGLFHSIDAGKTWDRIAGIDFAITLAVGAGSGEKGESPETVYFYGKLAGDDGWGIFRSTDNGTSWSRISQYPAGIFDQPTCLSGSWDTFGLVYVGFSGQSFAYGRPK